MATRYDYPHLERIVTETPHVAARNPDMLARDDVTIRILTRIGLRISVVNGDAHISCDLRPPGDIDLRMISEAGMVDYPDDRYRDLIMISRIEDMPPTGCEVDIYRVSGLLPMQGDRGKLIRFAAYKDVYAVGRWDVRVAEEIPGPLNDDDWNPSPPPWRVHSSVPWRLFRNEKAEAIREARRVSEALPAWDRYLEAKAKYERRASWVSEMAERGIHSLDDYEADVEGLSFLK